MNKIVPFEGALGGGGKRQEPRQPTITKDNLRSKDTVEIIMGLGHGPHKGLANGLRSLYFGDTPVANADGSSNFQDLYVQHYAGWTPAESFRPILGGFEDWRGIFSPLTYATPYAFTTQVANIQQIILRFRIKKLYRRGKIGFESYYADGAIPNELRIDVLARPAAGGAWFWPMGDKGTVSIYGKTFTDEVHEVRCFNLPAGGPWTFQVTVQTPNTEDAPCEVQLEGYYEVAQGQYGLTRSITVNTRMQPGIPITRTTDGPPRRKDGSIGIDMIDLRFLVNQLGEDRPANGNDPGGSFEASMLLLIEAKRSDRNNWFNPFDGLVEIRGRTTSPVVYEYRFDVAPYDGTYDVRVVLMSGEEENIARIIQWESLQEIVGGPCRFDGESVLHIVARASDQFSSLPEITAVMDQLIVAVPTNYDPVARTYNGAWDGTFKWDCTSNPAWCLYDLAMNPIYGARRFWPDLNLNRFDIYAAAQWCDELVPDGRGGWQPRYTFNGQISEARGIREQLSYMAGTFGAFLADDLNGNIRVIIDKDEEASALFTQENVEEGIFDYSYTSEEERYNDVTVRFTNAALDYQEDSRRIYDAVDQSERGVVPHEFIAVGCRNAHEAVRRAAFVMLSALTEREVVSFRTNRRGLLVQPGRIILVADPDMGYSVTGRVKSFDETRRLVHFMEPVYMEAGVLYELRFEVPNPEASATYPFLPVVVPLYGPYNGNVLVVETALAVPASVLPLYQFSLGAAGSMHGTPKPFRVIEVQEADGDPDKIEIVAREVNRRKWLLSDSAIDRNGVDFINLSGTIASASDLRVITQTFNANGAIIANVELFWTPSPDVRVARYRTSYRLTGAVDWREGPVVQGNRASIYDIPDGVYDFRVGVETVTGQVVSWLTVIGTAAGKIVPPANVAYLDISRLGDSLTLSWPAVPDADVSHYRVKYSPLIGVSATWETASDLVLRATGTSVRVAAIRGTYFVKAVDTSGVESLVAAFANTNALGIDVNYIFEEIEHPNFTGIKTNCFVENGSLKMVPGSVEAVYEFESPDMGDLYVSRVSLEVMGTGELLGFNMINWERLSDLENLTGLRAGDFEFRYEIKTWDGLVWSDWQGFATGDYEGRRFAFRVTMKPNRPLVIPMITSLKALIDMPDRYESGKDLAIGTGGATVWFSNPFRLAPSIQATGKNFLSGERVNFIWQTHEGFQVNVLNSSNQPVPRTIDWLAAGFGYIKR